MLAKSFLQVPDWCPLGIHSHLSDLLFSPFHPQNITCLFVIYFENEIHLFWQMLVLGQWPKLSLIFWTATQDLWFILCCQTNKIVNLSHCRIIIFLEGIQCWTLVLFVLFGAGQWCGSQTRSRLKCKPKMQLCYSNKPGLLEYSLD